MTPLIVDYIKHHPQWELSLQIHKYIDGYTGKKADVKAWTARKTEKVKCYKLSTIIRDYEVDEIKYLKIMKKYMFHPHNNTIITKCW